MRRRGFTLVEVLVACAVGLLLAGLAWPTYRGHVQRAARTEAVEALYRLQLAQEQHREMFGFYAAEFAPLRLATTTPGGRYQLALARSTPEVYLAQARATEGGPQQDDAGCTALTLEVRQGFATLGPEGRCWNR